MYQRARLSVQSTYKTGIIKKNLNNKQDELHFVQLHLIM